MAVPSINLSYLTLGLLIACTVIGIGVAARFRREVDEDLAPPTDQELLGPLEKAYYSGLMRPDEIERIRESVKKSRDLEPAPPINAAPRTRPTLAPEDPSAIPPADASPRDETETEGN